MQTEIPVMKSDEVLWENITSGVFVSLVFGLFVKNLMPVHHKAVKSEYKKFDLNVYKTNHITRLK